MASVTDNEKNLADLVCYQRQRIKTLEDVIRDQRRDIYEMIKQFGEEPKAVQKDCESCTYKKFTDRISALPDCNDCTSRYNCEFCPGIGQATRINCHLHTSKKED